VRAALKDVLGNGVLPDGSPGFFHPSNFTFGQPVHRSQLVARAMAVTGVAWVDVRAFRRTDSRVDVEHIAIGPLEIARLDNDPQHTENGTLQLDIAGSYEQLARQSIAIGRSGQVAEEVDAV